MVSLIRNILGRSLKIIFDNITLHVELEVNFIGSMHLIGKLIPQLSRKTFGSILLASGFLIQVK